MLDRFIANIDRQHLFPQGQEVLLAVSGGVDSVVLTHLMREAGYPFAMAHCNFHLRPGDCDRDEAFVRTLARGCGARCFVKQFDTLGYAKQEGLCLEEAARDLRYGWFEQLRRENGFAAIVTAHHRDDSAETFFLNILRGAGLAGLHGILPVYGNVVRPLLPFGRDEIEAYAAAHGLAHVEDSTNASLLYRRNQIRHRLLPLLRSIDGAADGSIARTIAHLQSVESLHKAMVELFRERLVCLNGDGTLSVSLAPCDDLPIPAADRQQLYYELLKPYGFNGTLVGEVLSAAQPGRRFFTPTHSAFLDRERIIIAPLDAMPPSPLKPELQVSTMPAGDFLYDLRRLPVGMAAFDAATVVMPVALRHWQLGDRFQPLGMSHGSQKVSDFFTDHKFSLADKQRQQLLVDAAGQILWIVGFRTSHPHRITPSTADILVVTIAHPVR